MAGIPMWRRYARLFGPDVRADVDEELRFHFDSKVEDLRAQGWSDADARREALRQFGDLRHIRRSGEQMGKAKEREMKHSDYWTAWAQDLRFAFRTLRRDRAFAVVTVLVLALGIATNTAVFSVVNTILLRPLPFPASEQLAWFISARGQREKGEGSERLSLVTYTVDAYEEYQRRNQSFHDLASYNPFLGNSEYTLTGKFEAQAVAGVMVSQNFFQTLGVQPVHGRLFTAEECQRGGRPAALLSYAFWQRQFAGDPTLVGQDITLSQQSVTVVGILPESFDFGSVFAPGQRMDLFVPAVMDNLRNWGNTLALVGRLKPGLSPTDAQTEADLLFPQILADHPEWRGDYTSTILSLKDHVSGKLRRPLIVLWCAVGLIMLIVCVNLSNLMLARGSTRAKEFATRTALGAGRGRILRQLLTESTILCGAGALLGLTLAFGLIRYLALQESVAMPLLGGISLDTSALLWTLLIATVTALLFGFVPALRAGRKDLRSALNEGGHGTNAGQRRERARSVLVVSEVALACVLLIGAGLLLRSFLHVLDVDLGFEPVHAGVIKVDYDDGPDDSPVVRARVLQEMLRHIREIPGVESAGVADMLPFGRNRSWGLSAKGHSYPKELTPAALVRIVTPGYLEAMGIQVREGRDFTWRDDSNSPFTVIINQVAARRFWQGEDALGKTAKVNGEDAQVIGIISDVRAQNVEETPEAEMYLTASQAGPEGAELVIRSKLPPDTLAAPVMKTLRALNPSQPATEFRPLRVVVDRAVSPRRFFVVMVSGFAALGLILASLGIYGVISYSVTQQTPEIGIRMALGATGSQVQLAVVRQALRLAIVGIAFGSLASLAVARGISSQLFGVTPTDPGTFAIIVLVLGCAAILAGYLPARRASRIEPILALRSS